MDAEEATGAARSRRFQAGEDPRKRAQILEGAYRVFLTMGYDAASMNDITREAGVSKGTIYVYFRNKEELFEALLQQESERQVGEVAAALDHSRSIADVLTAFGTALAQLSTSDDIVQVQRTIVAIAARMPDIAQRYYRKGPQAMRDLLARHLAEAVEKGHLPPLDPDLAAVQFIDLAVGRLVRERQYAVTLDAPGDRRIAQTVAAAVKLFLAGYAAGADAQKA